MAKLILLPSQEVFAAKPGRTVYNIAAGEIASACGGNGICGLCRVKIVSGHDKLSPYNDIEERRLGNLYHLSHLRLSCQCIVLGRATDTKDIVIEVPGRRRKKGRR